VQRDHAHAVVEPGQGAGCAVRRGVVEHPDLRAQPFERDLEGVNLGDFFTRPLATLPNWRAKIERYLKMPEKGFDKPFFMAHGLQDVDVPYALTAPYIATLKANHQPVTVKLYNNDHSGTLIASQKAAHQFVRRLFRGR